MRTYATIKELKIMAFKINSQKIKQKFGIQVIFISEINPLIERFLAKYECFFRDLCVHFEPLLGWEYAYACRD